MKVGGLLWNMEKLSFILLLKNICEPDHEKKCYMAKDSDNTAQPYRQNLPCSEITKKGGKKL